MRKGEGSFEIFDAISEEHPPRSDADIYSEIVSWEFDVNLWEESGMTICRKWIFN